MAFEPNYEKVVTGYRKNIGSTQSVVECKLPTTDEVKKILCANAKVYISNSEIDNKNVDFSGCVGFQVIYTNQDSTVQSVDYTAEFRDKFQTSEDLSGVIPVVSTAVVDINTVVANGEVKVVAIIETIIDGIYNQDITVLTNVTGDMVFVRKEEFDYRNYVGTAYEKFETSNDVEIKDGVDRVLSVCPSVTIDSVAPNERYLTVMGQVNLDICYLSDNGVLRTTQASYDFSQEIAQDSLTENSDIQSTMQIAICDVKITTSVDINNAIVNVLIPLVYTGYIYNNNSLEIVADVFSTETYTNLTIESVKHIRPFESVEFDDKITGSVTLDDSAPFIDELLGTCCNNVVLANTSFVDGYFTVEGVAHTTALYLNKEFNTVNSVEIEMPFSSSTSLDYPLETNALVQLSLGEVSARARRGKEIEVTANLEIYSDFYLNEEDAVINNIAAEDEIPEDECALSIYFAKDGDTVWDIAKEMRVSPETVLAQNPNLAEPIQMGTRVAIYRQRMEEF